MSEEREVNGAAGEQRFIRLWLVDDDQVVRDICAQLLGESHAVVCDGQFGTAEDVITALQCGPGPDAMLLDIGLPGMSGVEAVPIIKSLSVSTAVLMYSAFRNPADDARARAAGASGCMAKHQPIEDVLAAVREAVGQIAARPSAGSQAVRTG